EKSGRNKVKYQLRAMDELHQVYFTIACNTECPKNGVYRVSTAMYLRFINNADMHSFVNGPYNTKFTDFLPFRRKFESAVLRTRDENGNHLITKAFVVLKYSSSLPARSGECVCSTLFSNVCGLYLKSVPSSACQRAVCKHSGLRNVTSTASRQG
ncbi:hypothetical protein L9F63_000113, partial [Diploptera punctata]